MMMMMMMMMMIPPPPRKNIAVFLQSQGKALLRDTPGQPCLLQFGADCTRLQVQKTVSKKQGSKKVAFSGNEAVELYVQGVFLTTLDPHMSKSHRLVFREPIWLQHGKSMAALLAATIQSFPGINLLTGLRGRVKISHMVLDRGMTASFRAALRTSA